MVGSIHAFLFHAALLLAVTASPAFAQREPVIVIPGKPGRARHDQRHRCVVGGG